jgi:glycosyltransferase involved in cell wall biosynthesis
MNRHVLFVHDNRSLGGVGAVSRQLADGLAARGWKVDDFQLAQPRGAFKAAQQVFRERGVIVATQNFSASYAAAALSALTGRPWVMCVHGPVTQVLEASPVSANKRAFLEWIYRRAPVIACSSRSSLDSLQAFCALRPAQKVAVIRNTATPGFFAASTAPTELPAHRIGFVGRLSQEKQPMLLLEVLRQLPEAWQLDVVGTGPLEAAFRQAAHAEITNGRVRMHGLQPVAAATYREWQVTLLCSSYEGYPLVLLESLASGVPVVASPIPAAREMLEACAPFMVAPDDSAASIARAVLDLASRDAAEVVRAMDCVNRDHTPDDFIARWDELLTQALGA